MEEEVQDTDPREYELAVVLVSELHEPSFASDIEIIQKDGPKSVVLAYPIKKHTSAFLRVYLLRCRGAVAKELASVLRHDAAIIRYLLITPPIVTSRKNTYVESEHTEEQIKTVSVVPARAEAISNEALEEALEKILENESK